MPYILCDSKTKEFVLLPSKTSNAALKAAMRELRIVIRRDGKYGYTVDARDGVFVLKTKSWRKAAEYAIKRHCGSGGECSVCRVSKRWLAGQAG